MRKAFDANVPKLRPRLKSATLADEGEETAAAHASEADDRDVVAGPAERGEELDESGAEPRPELLREDHGPAATARVLEAEPPGGSIAPDAGLAEAAEAAPASRTSGPTSPARVGAGASAAAEPGAAARARAPESDGDGYAARPSPGFVEAPDVQQRRERLLTVKRRVQAAARVAPPVLDVPETPGRAGESALALVRELEGQLQRARELEVALRADLDEARAELGRGAAESRRTMERLAAMEAQVEEKRAVLQEMLGEMSALEEERDGAVERAQALTALDEERQSLLDGLSERADAAEKARAGAEAEVERLGAELSERAADAARLRAALSQVTRERDDLARELRDTKRERDELSEARKALEQVHEALANARSKLG